MKNKLFFLLILILLSSIVVLNKTSTQLIGINFKVSEYEVPLYLKLYNFYGRHLNYDTLINRITKNSQSNQDKVIHITKWLNNNIQKLPKEVDIVDSHPLTIIERRMGTEDQFSDLLSVMLVYAGVKSFFLNTKNNKSIEALTYFELNGNWSIIDPYYGIMFLNSKGKMASLRDLKESNWNLFTLDFEPINMKNFKNIFNNKFDSFEKVKESYMTQISSAPSKEVILLTNKFDLGGRSFIQNPFGRLQFLFSRLRKDII